MRPGNLAGEPDPAAAGGRERSDTVTSNPSNTSARAGGKDS